MPWEIIVEPEGRNPGLVDRAKARVQSNAENTGGMVIYLQNGSTREEVSRVAYIRRASKNPSVDFKDQLDKEVKKAKEAAALLNELTSESDVLA